MNKGEPQNLARRTSLSQSQIGDTSLNGAGDGGSYMEVVNDQPVYNASAGLPNDIIKSRSLNANQTAGVIAQPSFSGGMPDNMITPGGDVTNSEAMGELNGTYSNENRSAKYRRPGLDLGAGGNQYNTPQ